MKIAILGNAGSGKTTLALQLQQLLKLPLYHLDKYFWKPNWQPSEYAEFERIHNSLCGQPAWIIEGMNTRIVQYRIEAANIIIFLDVPRLACLRRVIFRTIKNFINIPSTNPAGCRDRFSLTFFRFIWNFNLIQRERVLTLLQNYPTKKIFIIQNQQDLKHLLAILKEYEKSVNSIQL
ncbi:hypothetical protein M1466_01230 [Candidatus Dependentiae bacterium]|nr:hypothetical protein [Candidatus Dependentiae bacterium]